MMLAKPCCLSPSVYLSSPIFSTCLNFLPLSVSLSSLQNTFSLSSLGVQRKKKAWDHIVKPNNYDFVWFLLVFQFGDSLLENDKFKWFLFFSSSKFYSDSRQYSYTKQRTKTIDSPLTLEQELHNHYNSFLNQIFNFFDLNLKLPIWPFQIHCTRKSEILFIF